MPAEIPTTVTPPNWLRRQCPQCGLFVTGLVEEGEVVAHHGCGPGVRKALDEIAGIFEGHRR
jgi:hypothetical protein